jgi:small GTP-binding protein
VAVDDKVVTLHVLDTAGQDEFKALRDTYMRDGEGFILVYAINDTSSFQEVEEMYEQLRKAKDADEIPVVLIGNKCDLTDERVVSKNEGAQLAKSWGPKARFFEASAKQRINVAESFDELVRVIRSEHESIEPSVQPNTTASSRVPKQKKGFFASSTSDEDKNADLDVV